MNQIFVYGTLKQGYGNHEMYLSESRFVGKAATVEKFELRTCGLFPIMMEKPVARVAGEVYEVDDATLAELDHLEGNGTMYHRIVISVDCDDGETREVETYIGDSEYWNGKIWNAISFPINEAGYYEWEWEGA